MTTDSILKALRETPGPLGTLAKAFPGRAAAQEDSHWIDEWFAVQANAFATGKVATAAKITSSKATPETLSALRRPPASKRVRLQTVQVNYLRGFRKSKSTIVFDDDLIVLEGR